jgi:RNA polymerase sigma-70 factor (ECF subfamily)
VELEAYAPFHLARADMQRRSGDMQAARRSYRLALDLTQNEVERDFIRSRIAQLGETG